MRWRSKLRRFRIRLMRFWARTTLARSVRLILTLWLVGVLLGGTLAVVRLDEVSRRLWEWTVAGWRFASGRVEVAVDAQNGKVLMGSVLPRLGEAALGPEPLDDWERPLRAWIHSLTGYDFASPRSFLEAEVGGFRRVVQHSLDIVRLPQGGADAAGSDPAGGRAAQGGLGSGLEAGAGRAVGAAEPPGPDRGRDPILERPDIPGSAGRGRGQESLPQPPATVQERLAALKAADWGTRPRVLILHSHTSESYRTVPPDPRADARHHVFNESDTGITRVGRAMAERLQQVYGIGTIHSTRIHNWPHHWEAYVNARETVQEILAAYPSIDIVLDVHRQGIENAVWATSVGGVEAVSVEVIYTTSRDFQYATHPNWKRNEAFAAVLANAMEEVHPGLLNRVTVVHNRRYNQDLHPHMLLLEVGNYLDLEEHAIAAARLLADAVAVALDEIQSGRIDKMVALPAVPPPQPPRPAPSSGPPRR